jgi:AraC family transcriptional regulator
MKRESTIADHRERVLRTVVEIERDLDRTASLEELAEHACLSPFHFHRIFAGLVGEGPAEYLRRLRLERAAHELATTRDRVSAIARHAGYVNPESFTRAFQARFTMSPTAFRAKHAPQWTTRVAASGGMSARIEVVHAVRVAFIRHVGPYEQATPQFERLRQWSRAAANRPPARREPLFIGMAHDIPGVTPAAQLRFDCCMEVGVDCRAEGEVGVQSVFGTAYAVALHQGTFATLAETYSHLARNFIPSQGATIVSGPSVEIYLTPPERSMTQPGLTEVLLPVRT